MELQVQGGSSMPVSEKIWGERFRQDLVHQVVVAYRAGGRAGTKAQKTRAEVHGTTKKSKRQKGGGARHGALTAPIFVGGGRTFAAKPRSFEQKVNRKMYRGAMRSILSELLRQDRLLVVESIGVTEPRTKAMIARLAELGVEGRVLLVTDEISETVYLAARNLHKVEVIDTASIDPVSLVRFDRVVIEADALRKVEERLA